MKKTITITLKSESENNGKDVPIVLSALTREQNSLFGQMIMPVILANCEKMVKLSPTLKGHVDKVLASIAVTGCQIPGALGMEAALAPDGMEILLKLMTRDNHPHEMDEITINRLLTEKPEETYTALLELLPLPKKVAPG